jgi:hypothetical protein
MVMTAQEPSGRQQAPVREGSKVMRLLKWPGRLMTRLLVPAVVS